MRIVEQVSEEEGEEIEVLSEALSVLLAKEVENTEEMIIDTGCPKTLGGESWILRYLEENNLKKSDMEIHKCNQYFKFGPGRTFHSEEKITLPISFKVIEKGRNSKWKQGDRKRSHWSRQHMDI